MKDKTIQENPVYVQTIGIILRFLLVGAAGVLTNVGVTAEVQESLVDEIVNYGVPLILAGVAFLWSIAQKRYANGMLQVASNSPATATLPEIAEKVNDKMTLTTQI